MFTGLIENTGKVTAAKISDNALLLEIESKKLASELKIGDSIAINGACQTVTEITNNSFKVYASPETMKITAFNELKAGIYVNLERPLKLSDRLDGHLVTGHVDSTAVVSDIANDSGSTVISFETSGEIARQIVKKGSITIDGISLTVCDIKNNIFSVSVIPHTRDNTCIRFYTKGTKVNIETDLIAKYIEKYLLSNDNINNEVSAIDMNLLEKNGFI